MNKKELINLLKEDLKLNEQDSTKIIMAVLDSITDSLNSGEKVNLRGFGTLCVKKRATRKARNIATGEIIEIPAQKKVCFSISDLLKKKIKLSKQT
jgi:DNA-binding protein HU-beta